MPTGPRSSDVPMSRARIADGLCPTSSAMSAATPAACGAAMLVPVIPTMKVPVWQTARANEKLEQAAHTGPRPVPPGAATVIAVAPKLLYEARASTFCHGPVVALVAAVGPVADTQTTWGALQ